MMTLSREITIFLNRILNDILPQGIRDFKWFGWITAWLVHGTNASAYINFHENIWQKNSNELNQTYLGLKKGHIQWETCLTKKAMEEILKQTMGKKILEIGSGKSLLAKQLSLNHSVIACDFVHKSQMNASGPYAFTCADAENLPFADHSFDTVISTHVLEHTKDLQKSMTEQRRVARSRIIIVLPCERPHKYTLNLHLHFFPYDFMVLLALKPPKTSSYTLKKIGGDWLYIEDLG